MSYMGIVLAAFAGLLAAYYYYLFRRVLTTFGVDLSGKFRRLGLILGCFLVFALTSQITTVPALALFLIAILDLLLLAVDRLLRLCLGKERYDGCCGAWKKVFGSCIIPVSFVLITFVYGYFNIHNLVRTHYEVTTEKEMDAEGFRICFLSDVHCSNALSQEEIRSGAKRISEENVDIVILGGDLLDNYSSQEDVEEMFRSFGSIKTKLGIYYIFGNHDRTGDYKDSVFTEDYIRQQCEMNGIQVLKDETVCFEEEGVTLIGREDASTHYGHTRESAQEVMSDVNTDSFVIVADHEPSDYYDLAELGADLILNGHLHAGQVLPGNLTLILFNKFHVLEGRYLITGGHAKRAETNGPASPEKGTATAIVSTGFAGWGYPIKSSGAAEFLIIDVTAQIR